MKNVSIAALAGAAMAALAPSAHAIGITQGDSTLDISGIVNGYYVNRSSETTTGGKVQSANISSGLLPGWVNFVFTSKVEGMDVKAHIGLAPGINDSSTNVGLPSAPGAGATGGLNSPYTQIDTRANYLSFGNAGMGTVKFGRDIGIFGTQVILSDMTLLGVGGTSNAAQPFNTTFGMIGHGYMYTGFQAQVSYTSPKFGPTQVQAGLFQPKQFSGNETKTPGIQIGATVDLGATKLWTAGVTQKTDCKAPCTTPASTASGYELGGKVGLGDAEVLAYTFGGNGLGLSTVGAQFFGAVSATGEKTKSSGYFLQGTYKLGKTKLGVNFGKNTDKDGAVGTGLKATNKSYTLGAYHSMNKFITLVGEYNNEKKSAVVFDNEKSNTFTLGAIMFF